MTKSEMYYLILVLGAFSAFALAVGTSLIHDRAWARRQARKDTSRGR